MPGGLFTDFYELTMGAGYHAEGMAGLTATFDLFFRDVPESAEIAIAAGLESATDFLTAWDFTDDDVAYLRSLGQFDPAFCDTLSKIRFTGEMCGIAEGTPVYPGEPVLRVRAPLLQAQLLETALINRIAHSSLIASHSAAVVAAAGGKPVLEFGARRAHGPDGAITGSRAAIIGGCSSTSLTEVGRRDGARVSGTQAHSWIMAFESELEAFRAYARTFPDSTILLVDTYDTLESGVANAIIVAGELRADGHALSGIRLDSGDLDELARAARSRLDEAGFPEVRIFASGDLNVERISTLERAGAPIDAYGVGTELATAKPDPAFTAVYKLAEINDRPAMKLSATPEKATNPGVKQVWRTTDGDVVGLADDDIDGRPLMQTVVTDGQRIREPETLDTITARCRDERTELVGRDWEVRRSPRLDQLRTRLLQQYQE